MSDGPAKQSESETGPEQAAETNQAVTLADLLRLSEQLRRRVDAHLRELRKR